MCADFSRDPYSLLGVSPDADADEIRRAYIRRVRAVHPDRIDRKRYPDQWRKANQMLADLNAAYDLLCDPARRAAYDGSHSEAHASSKPSPSPPRNDPPPDVFSLGDLTPGTVALADLPPAVREKLLRRERNLEPGQIQIPLSSPLGSYISMLAFPAWALYLFTQARGRPWDETSLWIYSLITIAVSLFLARAYCRIRLWRTATLRPYLYITRIYFIKTDFTSVSFRPIWTLQHISVVHRNVNFSYQDSTVTLTFDGHKESFKLSSKKDVERALSLIQRYRARIRKAFENRDYNYFLIHDDFRGVPRRPSTIRAHRFPKNQRPVYLWSLGLCVALFGAAVVMNHGHPAQGVARVASAPSDPTPNRRRPDAASPSRLTTPRLADRMKPGGGATSLELPLYTQQPLPPNGQIRLWQFAEPIAPLEIKGATNAHCLVKLVDTSSPSRVMTIFVRRGTTLEVDVPLGVYEMRYASGVTWYGYEHLFGPETVYARAKEHFAFRVEGDRLMGFTVTLYRVRDGNLRTERISSSEF